MSKHTQRKLSAVCTEESYIFLQNWIIEHQKSPYPDTPLNHFYRKTNHRQYLSKWLESVIVKLLKGMGSDPIKAPDAGVYRDNTEVVTDIIGRQRTIGSGNWTKAANVHKGRADIKCFFNQAMYNLEVKVGQDRMSSAQIAEQQRAEANGEKYVIIKTIEDFLILLK